MQKVMQKWVASAVSAVGLFLMNCWVFAATKEMEGGAEAPAEMVDVIYVVLFGLLFVGMIVGFFVYLWYLERKKKNAGQ